MCCSSMLFTQHQGQEHWEAAESSQPVLTILFKPCQSNPLVQYATPLTGQTQFTGRTFTNILSVRNSTCSCRYSISGEVIVSFRLKHKYFCENILKHLKTDATRDAAKLAWCLWADSLVSTFQKKTLASFLKSNRCVVLKHLDFISHSEN